MSLRFRVAIIGGGFSGAMTAVHLLRQNIEALEVTIIEPRSELGRGLAYSTDCVEHLLNVPASGMSALPNEPDHFLHYMQGKEQTISGDTFVPRRTYGEYLNWLIVSELREQSTNRVDAAKVEHLQSEVTDIERLNEKFILHLLDGARVVADCVVLALGNLHGRKPAWLNGIEMNCQSYIHDPWKTGVIEKIALPEDVLIVGTGLTAVDKIIELERNGHQGAIYALSRHGLMPTIHLHGFHGMAEPLASHADSALGALQIIRQQIGASGPSSDGDRWRGVIDGLRSTTQAWWQSLPVREQRKFVNHLITYWEIHRHRMAPDIGSKLEAARASGQLRILAGRILSISAVNEQGKDLSVSIKLRGGEEKMIKVQRIINCTGPQSSLKNVDSVLLANLARRDLVAPHCLGTGIAALADGQLLNRLGNPITGLSAIGPLLKAELLESIAVPELRVQAASLAKKIADLAAVTSHRPFVAG